MSIIKSFFFCQVDYADYEACGFVPVKYIKNVKLTFLIYTDFLFYHSMLL